MSSSLSTLDYMCKNDMGKLFIALGYLDKYTHITPDGLLPIDMTHVAVPPYIKASKHKMVDLKLLEKYVYSLGIYETIGENNIDNYIELCKHNCFDSIKCDITNEVYKLSDLIEIKKYADIVVKYHKLTYNKL